MAKQDEPNKVIYSMVGRGQGPRHQAGPQGHLPRLLLRRQDRRHRPQRLGQVAPCCASWPASTRSSMGEVACSPGLHRRLPGAGAAARPGQDRARGRRGGRARRPWTCWPSSRRSTTSFAEPMDDDEMDKLLERQGEVQEQLDALDAWDLDSPPRDGHGRPALPARRHPGQRALRRRAAPRGPVPAAAPEARHPAPRRAHQPPRRRDRGLARAAPAAVRGHGHRRHPRPLLPRQRGRLDPRARPRPGHPVEGQLLLAGSSRSRSACASEEKTESRAPEDPAARAGVDPHGAQGPPRQGQGAHQRLRAAPQPGRRRRSPRTSRSTSRPARAWATWSSRPRASPRASATTLLFET